MSLPGRRLKAGYLLPLAMHPALLAQMHLALYFLHCFLRAQRFQTLDLLCRFLRVQKFQMLDLLCCLLGAQKFQTLDLLCRFLRALWKCWKILGLTMTACLCSLHLWYLRYFLGKNYFLAQMTLPLSGSA